MAQKLFGRLFIGLAVILATACTHKVNNDDDPSRDLESVFGDLTQEVSGSPFISEGETVTSEYIKKSKRSQESVLYYYSYK